MKKVRAIIILCLFMLVAGCSKQTLSGTKAKFSDDEYNYTFQLPKGWKSQEDYKTLYNEAAIFGAEDDNSNSYMFIRTTKKNEADVDKFKQKKAKELKKAYDLHDIYEETFKVADFPVVAYTFQGAYDNEIVFVHDFYVMLDQKLVEFTFYSATEGNYEERAKRFEESVKTLSEEVKTIKTTESLSPNSNNQKVENNEAAFTLTGYKIVTASENKEVLIIRYIFKNKQDTPTAPNMWDSVVQIEQEGKKLSKSSLTESEEATDLSYLLEVGKTPISKNESVESASVYDLPSSTLSDIIFTFDQEKFEESEPIHLLIKND